MYQPLPHVKHIYYLDVNFYRYYIGRQDQSVNEEVMIGRIDQQIQVTKLMLGYYDAMKISSRKLPLLHDTIPGNHDDHLFWSWLSNPEQRENLEKKKELWQYLKSRICPLPAAQNGLFGTGLQPSRQGRKGTFDSGI